MKDKALCIFFELFGERIVDRQYTGDGHWVARRGWQLKFRNRLYYYYFEDYS